VNINTTGFSGRNLRKNISVYTNDAKNPKLSLKIRGRVEKVVTITPEEIRLTGFPDQQLEGKVAIIPEDKYPFKIVNFKARSGRSISFKLTLKKSKGKPYYLLTVKNLRKKKGRYSDTIYLETDSKVRSKIRINIHGDIFEKDQKGEI